MDFRDRAAMRGKIEEPVLITNEDEEIKLPWVWGVCPTCEGRGKYVNPSIDSNGLTYEDFQDDPEFERDYFGGMYDITCVSCEGRTTVPVPNFDAMSEDLQKAWKESERAIAEMYAESEAERRMGA